MKVEVNIHVHVFSINYILNMIAKSIEMWMVM